MKKFLVAVFIGLQGVGFAQELASDFTTLIDKKADVFQIVDDQKKQVVLFYTGKETIRTVLLNNELQVLDSLQVLRNDDVLDNLMGYSYSENIYRTFWSGDKGLVVQSFDFTKKQNSLKEIPLALEKERVLKHLTVNGVYYIVSVVKESNILNLYKYEKDGFSKKTIDLSAKKFVGHDNKFSNLYDIFGVHRPSDHAYHPELISNETPPSLVLSSHKRKIYAIGNQIVLTLDVSVNYTQVITINLEDFSFESNALAQPKLDEKTITAGESNSIVLGDKVIQLRANSGKLALKVKNRKGEELKSYEIMADGEIPFKNSDIIQENGSVTDVRVLDKSNQLIRKINNLDSSLSAYQLNDKIYMTLGGVQPPSQNSSGIMVGGMVGGFAGAVIMAAITSNYSMNNLNSYKGRKVVYINCVFDSEFNHVEDQPKKLAFDRLRVFAEKNQHLRNATVFKLNDILYFGGYKKESKKYSFYKFSDL